MNVSRNTERLLISYLLKCDVFINKLIWFPVDQTAICNLIDSFSETSRKKSVIYDAKFYSFL